MAAIVICAVGRIRPGPERDLAERYLGRIRWPVDVREVEERRRLPAPDLRRREGELLEAACPGAARRVALDASGEACGSVAFARRLGRWIGGGGGVAFVIGGAYGLARPHIDGADARLAFGAATWPHMLVRVMLLEQIYRAQEILAGGPYHHGGRPPPGRAGRAGRGGVQGGGR